MKTHSFLIPRSGNPRWSWWRCWSIHALGAWRVEGSDVTSHTHIHKLRDSKSFTVRYVTHSLLFAFVRTHFVFRVHTVQSLHFHCCFCRLILCGIAVSPPRRHTLTLSTRAPRCSTNTPRSCSLTFESRSVGGAVRAPCYKPLQRDPGERGGPPLARRPRPASQSQRAPPPRRRRPLYHFRRREAKRILCGGATHRPLSLAPAARSTPRRLAPSRSHSQRRGDWPGWWGPPRPLRPRPAAPHPH